MTLDIFDTLGLTALRTSESQTLLDEIDSLRRQGISEFVFLPQIIVCGDQSSGKSSTLEAISGVPFPRNDTICTRFATEVILREADTSSATVSIVPSQETTSQRNQEELLAFRETLSAMEDLPALMAEAMVLMGISTSVAFSRDILRVEISGPNKPKLTVVDLPGLIHSGSKQQPEADVKLISDLVRSYMENPRSIILAVVSAKNDYPNQIILKRAKELDPRGLRTLGLITKPDDLPVGSDSEEDFIKLANNKCIEFQLGWHVVKNRDYESRHASTEERDRSEKEFLSTGVWKNLPSKMVGIVALRQRLSKILLDQIKTYLPSLAMDIQANIDESELELLELGDNRATIDEQRQFLLKLSQSFERLCKSAVGGDYGSSFFGDPLVEAEYQKRLRGVVQNLNLDFAKSMRTSGHRRIIHARGENLTESAEDQIIMRRNQAIKWVRQILERSRGRELPGSFNPLLVGELFRDQSCLWEKIARRHVERIVKAVKGFLDIVLEELADHEILCALFSNWITGKINERFELASQSLDRLLANRATHPITYDHSYTETLQNMRQQQQIADFKKNIRSFLDKKQNDSIGLSDTSSLAKSLATQSESDMDDVACSELLDSMQAYYKVALNRFIDNVAIQVIERDLVGDLWVIFTPTDVGNMPDALISQIAAESEESRTRRQELERKLDTLRNGLEICRRHAIHVTFTWFSTNPYSTLEEAEEKESYEMLSLGNWLDEATKAEASNLLGQPSEGFEGGIAYDSPNQHAPEPESESEFETETKPAVEPFWL
ncbi:hypothetical protein EMCG_05226 [[Emmonsia] crescens]|uniref:Dynamin GTPase n=1 Tax=[Emmonsia] crescens TaxID=73230 RepID=A0A0G2IXW4_9EURO|nr:hypothetical protein EMCG_05226 [Emmonsia crescens UAMH 3008]